MKIRSADKNDIAAIRKLALKIWKDTYVPIVGKEQVDFMLDEIYSQKALEDQFKNEQKFLLIFDEDEPSGFSSYLRLSQTRYKIPKLYVDTNKHGKGLGKALLDEVFKRVKNLGGDTVELNVNRHNKARWFYEKYGFKIIREEDLPIGKYWMNDYVMEKSV